MRHRRVDIDAEFRFDARCKRDRPGSTHTFDRSEGARPRAGAFVQSWVTPWFVRHDGAVSQPLRVAYTLEQCWHSVPGGSAVAALEVASRLSRSDDIELIGVAGRHRSAPDASFTPPIAVRQLALGRPWLYEAWNRVGRPLVERVAGTIDVCHSTVAIPAGTRAAQVVTVHDVAFMHTPERFTRHGSRVMRAGLDRTRAADLVVCPSEATTDDLVALGFDASRIRLVPWGVDVVAVDSAEQERVRSQYALPERFVLFVGTVEPRKNLHRLAAAVDRLDERVALVVAGAPGWGDAAPSDDVVRFLGFVPAADLRALYATATAFAYPSLHEGFGLPVVEAMAHGTPVVTSRGTATEEVAAGAALLVDPLDVDSIAAGLSDALAAPERWIAAGLERAGAMSWDATATATIAAYREVAP
jgi:glycosyltransferase involved in cell wall biosynthesis